MPAYKKNALNSLRKFDAAGRMMETDEGELAGAPCSWCTRDRLAVECRVYKGKREKACAYCRRHGKAGCFAGDPGRAPAPSTSDRLLLVERSVEERLLGLEAELLFFQDQLAEEKQKREALEERIEAFSSRLGLVLNAAASSCELLRDS